MIEKIPRVTLIELKTRLWKLTFMDEDCDLAFHTSIGCYIAILVLCPDLIVGIKGSGDISTHCLVPWRGQPHSQAPMQGMRLMTWMSGMWDEQSLGNTYSASLCISEVDRVDTNYSQRSATFHSTLPFLTAIFTCIRCLSKVGQHGLLPPFWW